MPLDKLREVIRRIEARGPNWKSYPDSVSASFDDGIWVQVRQHGNSYRIEIYDSDCKGEVYSLGYVSRGEEYELLRSIFEQGRSDARQRLIEETERRHAAARSKFFK